MAFSVHDIFTRVSPYFRRRRIQQFIDFHHPTANTKILDVGGLPGTWQESNLQSHIIIMNIRPANYSPTGNGPIIETTIGDGCALSYPDNSFDIVFSNSVIEHVGTFEKQKDFAREARRVGRRLWVQTPARSFFLEPHLISPFIHYFPKKAQRHLIRNFTVWGWINRPNQKQVDDFIAEVRLLNYREMKELFPDCKIIREKFLGFTKSYIAIRQ